MKVFNINGVNLTGKKGAYVQKLGKVAHTVLNYVFDGKTLITGTSAGQIVPWHGTSLGKPVPKAHNGPIWVILPYDATSFFSGGNDGFIKKWD